MKKKLLITCCNGVTSYKLLSLLKKNYIIYGIDVNDIGAGKTMCDYFFKSPYPNSKKYIPFIKKIIKKVDLVFLYSDEELKAVSLAIKNKVLDQTKIIISDYKTLEICLDKQRFDKFFKTKNQYFKIPRTNLAKMNIIKPVEGRGSKNILKIKDKKIINFFLNLKNKFIVQEYLPGKEYTIDCYFDKNGFLLSHLIRERVVKSNVSISSKIIDRDLRITKCINFISKKLKFIGPINVQIIKNKNQLYLIEINPRLSGSLSFSLDAGFDPFRLSAKEYLNYNIKKFYKSNFKYFHRYYDFIKKESIS